MFLFFFKGGGYFSFNVSWVLGKFCMNKISTKMCWYSRLFIYVVLSPIIFLFKWVLLHIGKPNAVFMFYLSIVIGNFWKKTHRDIFKQASKKPLTFLNQYRMHSVFKIFTVFGKGKIILNLSRYIYTCTKLFFK